MREERVLIVEGSSDRKRLAFLIDEPVEIICTNGTISPYELEEMLDSYKGWEMFVFVDADDSGEKIRTLFKREFPLAIHLYTEKVYKEVATTPYEVLASALTGADIKVRSEFLK